MSIYSMRVKNYKTITDSEIEFRGNLSGIYGPNGTGKTAILEVLNIVKEYFLSTVGNENTENLKRKILEGVSIGTDTMLIETIFYLEDTLYKLVLEFKIEGNNVYTLREELFFKEPKLRRTFKSILKIINEENEIFPKMFLGSSTKNTTEIFKYLSLSQKNILIEFNNFHSYLGIILRSYDKNLVSQKNLKFEEFITKFKYVCETLSGMVIVFLKEQALYNLGLLIPLNIHTEKAHGVIPINLEKEANIYPKEIAEVIENVISQIGALFSSIVPKSKLIIKKEMVISTEESQKFAINIYVEKNEKIIPLAKESTGIIKLVSLLSAMVYYVKDENAIVAIDELDIHIFEYLLATLLEKLSLYAKGQLIFTAHNLLPLEKLNKDSIIISTKNDRNDIEYTYLKGISATTNLRQKYLKSQRMWSEDNIEPLLMNISALEMYVKKLVM
ncbi:AAA family ATPase [Fusobacterium sp.]|uniref:AAA family ATPase n=1 Tax=Fusobacterium sp. TaxID=68766 RepID=UPI0025BB64C7|nr:AAA family ATPase [Fusobacterium sp.]MCI5725796.1 ATP-binding protein [Fusobacterium sp.]MCI7223381.1 ATP-binding protein [Fusobacterium sp.]